MDSETLSFSKDDALSLFCTGRVAGQDKLGHLQNFSLDRSEKYTLWRMYETRGYALQELEIKEPEPPTK